MKFQARKSFVILNVVFVSLMAVKGYGQIYQGEMYQYKDYDRYRYMPRLPQGPENPPPLPFEEKEVEGDKKVLVESLKGIFVTDDPERIQQNRDVQGVELDTLATFRMPRSAAFQQTVSNYIGGPVSLYRLNELTRDIIRYYRQCNQPVVDVSFPAGQDITNGVIQMVITEAKIGEVRVEGPCYFDSCMLEDQIQCLNPGCPIYETTLQEELRWLYRNPYRKIDLELKPGEERGFTDIIFNVKDRRPLRIYAGYEDTGTRPTQLERLIFGATWYNAFWRDDYAGYQFSTSPDGTSLNAHSGFYSTALKNRDIVTVYGSWARFEVPGITATSGESWQLLNRWYRELEECGNYEHGVTAGFDTKHSNNNLEFGGQTIFSTPIAVNQFMAGYSGFGYDKLGKWGFGADLFYSPGHWGGNNTNEAFQAQRPFSTANYFYTRAYGSRWIKLNSKLEFATRITAQLADGNLPFTEQLGLGGYNSVRGYDIYSVLGDSGYFSSLELWTTPRNLFNSCDELRFLTFYDFGNAYNHTLLPGEDGNVDMQSLGLGARYMLPDRWEVRIDYGWQLVDVVNQPQDSRVHIGFVGTF